MERKPRQRLPLDKQPGQRLKMVRKHMLKINSSYTLSELTGVPQSTIMSYESGRNDITCSFLSIMHRQFGVNPNYIIIGETPELDNPSKKAATVTDISNMKSDIIALKAMVDYLKKRII